MKTDTIKTISVLAITFGVLILFGSYQLYDVLTWEDSDPPYEPVDYDRARTCTMTFILPGIVLIVVGLAGLLWIRNLPKIPPPKPL